jgi:hypothetical protein
LGDSWADVDHSAPKIHVALKFAGHLTCTGENYEIEPVLGSCHRDHAHGGMRHPAFSNGAKYCGK